MYYNTYAYYDDKGRRLYIFARKIEKEGKEWLELFKGTCSKRDDFNKKIAREIYNTYLSLPFNVENGRILVEINNEKNNVKYHPEIINIPLNNGIKYEMLLFCNRNFRKRIIAKFEVEKYVLAKIDKI